MKRTMITLLATWLVCVACPAQNDSLLVVFWNVENFFDYNFPNKPKTWTKSRFYTKCDAVAKTMLKIADEQGRLPDIIAFAEVENAYVVRSIVSTSLLRKLDYSLVHYDSPDRRGIDCALLYRKSVLSCRQNRAVHIRDSSGTILRTRDILVAEFDSLAVLVNHHPSKIGGKSERRLMAMESMLGIVDSLRYCGCDNVLALGDFNETLWPDNTNYTLKYNGRWEKIDGCFAYGRLRVKESVFCDPILLTEDKSYGGLKPRRCFVGPRYMGGVSDHLPIVLWVYVKK